MRPVPSTSPKPAVRPKGAPAPTLQPRDGLQLSPAEQDELKAWKDRVRPEVGQLQSPPVGSGTLDTARTYVDNLLQRVAGEDLKSRGVSVRVEVFSGDIPQAGLDDGTLREEIWNDDHPDQKWPIRTWYGVEQGKSFYRLAVNAGLLRTLRSEDEVAFVIAQQASQLLLHDRQDPNNEVELSVNGKSWIEPGEMQAGADANGIDRMVKANFNPHAALSALEALYKSNPEKYSQDDQKRALEAAAAGHEHEGLRVSLVQTRVEQLKRSGHPTLSVVETPIPAGIAPPGPSLYEKAVEDFPKFQENFAVLTGLLTDSTPEWMFDNGPKPPQVPYIRRTEAARDDYERVLVATCQQLANSDKTPQQQVDGVLRLILAVRGDCLPEEKPFSTETAAALGAFLSQPGWQPEAFLASLGRDQGETQSLHREFVEKVLFNETFQQLVGPLGGAWDRLVGAMPESYGRDPKTGAFEVESLVDFYRQNQDEPECTWALATRNDAATRAAVARLDGPALAQKMDKDGLPLAVSLSNRLLTSPHQDGNEVASMQEALKSVLAAGQGVREDHARLRLRPPLAEPAKVTAYVNGLAASEPWGAFSPAFNSELPALLLDVARTTSDQVDMPFAEGRPQALEAGAERRLCELLETSSPSDQRALVRTLVRHWPHETRVPASSSRRPYTQKLSAHLATLPVAKMLVEPDRSQHEGLLKRSLTETYGCEVPDTSTATLKSIEERRQAGEFTPKPGDYPDEQAYYQALDDYYARVDKLGEGMKFLAPVESRLVLGPLALLGHDPKASAEATGRFSLDDFKGVLAAAEESVDRSKVMRNLGQVLDEEPVGVDAGATVLEGFLAVQAQVPGLEDWYGLASRSIDFCSPAMQARPATRKQLGDALFPRLSGLESAAELRTWMGKEKVLEILAAEQSADLLVKVLGSKCAPGADIDELSAAVAELNSGLKLQEEYPVVYHRLRSQATETARLQPATVDQVFPPDPRDGIEEVSVFGNQMRGLSSLLAISRGRSPQEQIDTIEYLMGRLKVMPAYLETASEQQSFAPVAQTIRNVRAELVDAEPMARVVIANSFLAGPSGILRNPEGREATVQHFLKGVPQAHLALARKVAESIVKSQGDSDTLAVAFMLGQKPKPPQPGEDPNAPAKLDEAAILSRLFDSYGVPGVKMKQYLAFTSEFADFREAFEDAQDASMPLNYYQVLKLIQKRFGDEWPEDLKVERVLGSGSVNVAIKYFNKTAGKNEVVSLGREDIVESTRYDFDRFHKFLDALTDTPEDKEKFGYILGLLGVIEDSVKLEFDKESAMSVQQTAYKSYQRKFQDWTVRSIDAYSVKNLGMFMEEAKGKTARKILTTKPELYREAMRPMATVEMGILKGQDNSGNWLPKTLFANPDFHDGQVLIDEATKTVSILDFGQAVPIDNEQRKTALDMLTIIGRADSAKSAAKRLNARFFEGKEVMTADDMRSVLDRKERMDRFIHMLSLVSQKGADVPISSVHWVLGLNRQLALGKKLGQSVQSQVRNMVITHKVGLPLGVYNTAHAIKEKVTQWAGALAHCLVGWAFDGPANSVEGGNAPQQDGKPGKEEDSWAWNPEDSFLR
ncbi:hypothetical protein IV102_25455 [bacterium]|nr:hypothetical protein [bacterium]